MRRILAMLAVGALVASCSDAGPMAPMEQDQPHGVAFSHQEHDLRTAGEWAGLADGALVQSGGEQGTGAGTFPSFLLYGTTQSNDGKGYNTDASGPNRQYEISGGNNTRSVPLNSIPTIAREGVIYREFRFDGQAPGAAGKKEYSLDDIRIFLVPNEAPNNAISNFLASGISGWRAPLGPGAASANKVWDMNPAYSDQVDSPSEYSWLHVSSDLSSGQGSSDLRLLVPNERFLAQIPQEDYQACAFDGFDYAQGSTTALDSDCPWMIYFVSSHGFAESKDSGNSEWSVAFRPVLLVSKTAVGAFDRSFDWTVEKTVDLDEIDLFTGDVATVEYTIDVEKGEPVDTNHRVEGVITMENASSGSITITEVKDILELQGEDPIEFDFEDMECEFAELPYTIAAGETVTCSYSVSVDDELDGVNNVIVEADDPLDAADDGSLAFAGFAPVVWNEEPTNVIDASVTVEDVFNPGDDEETETFGPTSESATFSYSRTFTCGDDEGTWSNVASIFGDDAENALDSDGADVTVNCHELKVEKDAAPEFTRTFAWDIDKFAGPEADPVSELNLQLNQSHQLDYTVKVWVDDYTDSDWMVSGTITIENESPIDALLEGVSDVVSPDIEATVTCGDESFPGFPYTLEAGETLECHYTADLPNADSRTNTATATIQNHHYYWDVDADEGEGALVQEPLLDEEEDPVTTDFTGTEDVVFGNPTTMVNQCIDVADAFDGMAAHLDEEVCVPTEGEGAYEDASATFVYTVQFGGEEQGAGADLWFGPLECFDNVFDNTASFASQDLDEMEDPLDAGSADWSVNAYVDCAIGCTLTQGYWKTHNEYFRSIRNGNGPPLDEIWELVGLGLDGGVTGQGVNSTFFLSGGTWGEAMWPSGSANSNLYYQAASQWIAAYLNVVAISEMDGAPSFEEVLAQYPQVEAAFEAGLAFFESTTPQEGANLKGQDAQQVRAWRSTLAAFNEGDIGPGHCDEDDTSEG